MEFFDSILMGFSVLMGWKPILIIVVGVIVGILAGAMPGLSPSTAVALLVPFSYTMAPGLALILLTSIYIASNYGGSITAVLINTPGTPSAAVTAMDGYPLTQQGKAGKGLGTALIVANIIMLFLGLYGNRMFIKVVSVPDAILYPLILAIAVIGSFAVSSSMFDVAACIGFGIVGWIFKRYGYPVAPVVLGIVLGNMVEENFRRAVIMDGYGAFFRDKLALIVLLLALLSFIYPLFKQWRERKKSS